MEKWKDIKDFEGKYQVSNEGKIKSLNYNNTGKEKILIPKINRSGILEVSLSKNNKTKYCMLNRLVFETFTNTELTKNDIIMHKDKDKTNCNLDNLYIITRGKRQEITYNKDKRYRPKYEYYGQKLSTKEIAKANNVKPELIRNRIRALYWNIYEAAEIPKERYQERIKGGKNG